jgi:hypothetical protein
MPERSSPGTPTPGSPTPTPPTDGAPTAGAKFTLKTPAGKPYLSAPEAESAVRDLINRVEGETAARADKVTLRPNIQSFVVSGPRVLIDRIAAQPEIASAIGDHSSEDLFIRPTKRRDASLSDAAERPVGPGPSGKRATPKRKAARKSSPSKGATRRKAD